MPETKCPNCNVVLEELDFETYYGFNTITKECLGECPKCQKKFIYEETFHFNHSKIIEEYEEVE